MPVGGVRPFWRREMVKALPGCNTGARGLRAQPMSGRLPNTLAMALLLHSIVTSLRPCKTLEPCALSFG